MPLQCLWRDSVTLISTLLLTYLLTYLQYVECISKGYWKWHYLIDRIEFLLAFHSDHGAILRRLRDIASYCRKSVFFHIQPAFDAPIRGTHRNFAKTFSNVKQEWLVCNMLKKVRWYVKPFRYNPRTWQTDVRRTDGRTVRIAISISRVS